MFQEYFLQVDFFVYFVEKLAANVLLRFVRKLTSWIQFFDNWTAYTILGRQYMKLLPYFSDSWRKKFVDFLEGFMLT